MRVVAMDLAGWRTLGAQFPHVADDHVVVCLPDRPDAFRVARRGDNLLLFPERASTARAFLKFIGLDEPD